MRLTNAYIKSDTNGVFYLINGKVCMMSEKIRV